MMGTRHESWDQLNAILDQIVGRYGGIILDARIGKSWDPGQAICAELYGPDWNDDPQFIADNQCDDDQPVPDGGLQAAQRLANGQCDWAHKG